jgi:hypothetical protein
MNQILDDIIDSLPDPKPPEDKSQEIATQQLTKMKQAFITCNANVFQNQIHISDSLFQGIQHLARNVLHELEIQTNSGHSVGLKNTILYFSIFTNNMLIYLLTM